MNRSYDLKHLVWLNLSTLLVAFAAIFVKLISMNAGQVVLFRSLIAGFILGLFLKFRRVPLWKRFTDYPGFFLVSGTLLGLHWVFLFWAVKISSVSLSILAVFTFPVITTLLEPLFFNMRLIKFNLITAILTLIGIAFLVPEYNLQNKASLGILLAVLAAFLIAARNLLCKKYIQKISGIEQMFFQLAVSAILLLPFIFLERPVFDLANILYLLALGVVTTVLGHTLFVYCLKFFPASTASIIISLQPFYGIVLAMLILKERPGTNIFIGGILIIGVVLLENIRAAYYGSRDNKTLH